MSNLVPFSEFRRRRVQQDQDRKEEERRKLEKEALARVIARAKQIRWPGDEE